MNDAREGANAQPIPPIVPDWQAKDRLDLVLKLSGEAMTDFRHYANVRQSLYQVTVAITTFLVGVAILSDRGRHFAGFVGLMLSALGITGGMVTRVLVARMHGALTAVRTMRREWAGDILTDDHWALVDTRRGRAGAAVDVDRPWFENGYMIFYGLLVVLGIALAAYSFAL